jgi:hypothetical protein
MTFGKVKRLVLQYLSAKISFLVSFKHIPKVVSAVPYQGGELSLQSSSRAIVPVSYVAVFQSYTL